jgi:hypothetical protein
MSRFLAETSGPGRACDHALGLQAARVVTPDAFAVEFHALTTRIDSAKKSFFGANWAAAFATRGMRHSHAEYKLSKAIARINSAAMLRNERRVFIFQPPFFS